MRSNRLDVCVLDVDGRDCDTPPEPARDVPPSPVPQPTAKPAGSNRLLIAGARRAPSSFRVGELRVRGLRVTGDGHASGLVGLRWETTGGATKAWRVEYRVTTDRRPRWRRVASGTTQQSALLDLPVGRTVDLRARFTPPGGSPVTRTIGTVVVPTDERSRQLTLTGKRTRMTDPMAWRRTLTVLRRGAAVRTTLPAGRPAIVVRSDAARAVIEVRSGKGKRQRLTIRGRSDGRTAIVRAKRRTSSSAVRVRVVSGVVRLDGVAVTR